MPSSKKSASKKATSSLGRSQKKLPSASHSLQKESQNLARFNVAPAEASRPIAASRVALANAMHPGMNLPCCRSLYGTRLNQRDLTRVCFNQTDLRQCQIRDSSLRGARFKGCDLSGSDLQNSNLEDTLFENCVLDGTSLRECLLNGARLIDCHLTAVNLDQSCLDDAVIDSCHLGAQSFYGSSLVATKIHNSQFVRGFLNEASFVDAELDYLKFKDCTLEGTLFVRSRLEECAFIGCEGGQAGPDFSNGQLNRVILEDCDFNDPKWADTVINNTLFTRVDLNNALLEGTRFSKVLFERGLLRSCYSLEKSPSFDYCRMNGLVIDRAELSRARFNRSRFVAASITDSDIGSWKMNRTALDGETVVE